MEVQLEQVPVTECVHSRFNTRKSRTEEQIQRLADRIQRVGFEATRALWGVRIGGQVEVFAGGTRLEAARVAGLATVPVLILTDIDELEIGRRADVDNENDEYHLPVSAPDVWAEYHRLATEEGWPQQRIADAKGCDVSTVSLRIKMHTTLPEVARQAALDGFLDEGHLTAVLGVTLDVQSFDSWLTSAQAQAELVAEVLKTHTGSSVGSKPTVKVVRDAAKRWKEVIAQAASQYDKIEAAAGREQFIAQLAATRARTTAAVNTAYTKVMTQLEKAAQEAADRENQAAAAARREREQAERIDRLTQRILHGDARAKIHEVPAGIHLLLTDPPYGLEFQSNRRKASPKKAKIENDSPVESLALLKAVLQAAFERMAADSTALIFTCWRQEPAFRRIIEDCGFTIRGSLVWVKRNHGAGDLAGSFAPAHERIVHAVKGNPKLTARQPDVLPGQQFAGSEHPTEKPLDLLDTLSRATTEPGQLVVDPFAGSGATLLAALKAERDCHGIELAEEWFRHVSTKLYDLALEAAAGKDE